MKKLTIFILVTVVYAVPPYISYQGLLHDDQGQPISGTIEIMFSLYAESSGGTAVWSETQTVLVSNGLMNVKLGLNTPLPSGVFKRPDLYLGVKVGADPEMTPRQQLTSSSFSLTAQQTHVGRVLERQEPSYFGTGADGDFVSGGSQTFIRGKVYNFQSFNLEANDTITATGGIDNSYPIIIKVAGDCEIHGTIDLQGAGMPGGQDLPETLEGGKPGWVIPEPSGRCTGGGGGAGTGWQGQDAVQPGGLGGQFFIQFWRSMDSPLVGAGGGSGAGYQTSHGGSGGHGGGAIVLMVGGNLIIDGTINVSGANGLNGSSGGISGSGSRIGAGGGGGGGGGAILIVYGGLLEDVAATFQYSGGSMGLGAITNTLSGFDGGVGGSGKLLIYRQTHY